MSNDSVKLEMIRKAIEIADYIEKDDACTIDDIRDILDRISIQEDPEDPEDDAEDGTSIYPDSAWIDYFNYNKGTEELTMKTQQGRKYVYHGVSPDLWHDMTARHLQGGSVGAFYNEWIKGEYSSDKLY